MPALQVSVAPNTAVEIPRDAGPVFVDIVYSRAIDGQLSGGVADLPNAVQETLRFVLDDHLTGSFLLAEVAPTSRIDLSFLSGDGTERLGKSATAGASAELSIKLTKADISAITAVDPEPDPSKPIVQRRAYFVPTNETRVPFEASTLQVAPIKLAQGGWSKLGLDKLFLSETPITSSIQWPASSWAQSGAVSWTSTHVAVDGQFAFTAPLGAGDAWMWWLAGPMPAVGVVLDDLKSVRVVRIGVPLPPFTGAAPASDMPGRTPVDVTEAEVASNPGVYTEDPGEYCRPFKNPERVLGERSFFVILRAEQPVISAESSVVIDPLPTLGYDVLASSALSNATAIMARTVGGARAPLGTIVADTPDVIFERHALPTTYLDMLRRFNRGRTEMDAQHPLQWESDISRYQATTVARGHILEFRMRWRSNGYSLGSVAKTLTLAPRQTRRIQKIEWQRSETTRRQEVTQFGEQASDTLQRERDYDDSVQANLSEWSRGRSDSSMSAGAVGAGFAAGGFVIGGGGVESNAHSSSSQEGGRRTSASEEQRLRDSIRRYGDSLRKFESVVVTEVTQEETTTGTTEVVRNQNYAHSLTVIYYQILRHLKIETAVAGVRECLFVPLPIRPFTVARAYRWRDLIRTKLRDPRLSRALDYLKDVLSNFANSTVPAGRRSDQPIAYIFGSLFIKLAIDRPKDKDDGGFDVAAWASVQPFLGSPALSIYTQLKVLAEQLRDAAFQRDHAPTIAANWVDTLKFEASGVSLAADFTLATRYQFNGVVRVDFSISNPSGQQPVTRELLANIRVKATKDLPPGSVANLQSISFTYQTAQFERKVSASQGSGDLVEVETGIRDTGGATVGTIPDLWERQDIRAEMTEAVSGLLEHLNNNVEFYHKAIWWMMDRDRLFMLIDGFYVPGTNGVSIASVVERDPIAIVGNAIVFRVTSGAFLGTGNIKTPGDLFNHYVSLDAQSEAILVSLPTDGLYAQALMDECPALEEHFGNTDWALNDPDPELGSIAPELLASRRADPIVTQPGTMPSTLINLQNAPEAPAPSGLAGVLSAVTNPNSFRDMAGLAGTQANAATAFQTAATLASSFGAQAAALKLAETADKAHATQTADQKLATVQRAVDKGLTSTEDAQQHASKILDGLHPIPASRPDPAAVLSQPIFASASSIKAATPEYQLEATLDGGGGGGGGGSGGGVGGGSAASLVAPFPPPIVLPRDMANTGVINCIEAASHDADVRDLCGGLVDVTGDPALPPYSGHNDTDVLFVGSLAKIYAMYVAFELRRRVTKHAKDMIANGVSTTTAAGIAKVFADLKTAWKPQLDAAFPGLPSQFPDLTQIFTLAADGEASFTQSDPPLTDAELFAIGEFGTPKGKFLDWMKLMLGFSNDQAASLCIRALSYPYLNGVLGSAGFFNKATNEGLWISGDYRGNDWLPNQSGQPQNRAGQKLTPRWAQLQGRQKSNFTGTAYQVARLLSAIAQGVLVDSASCKEMIDIMGVPFMRDALSGAAPPRPVTNIVGKVGIGDETNASLHDCAIVTVDRGADPALHYVAVVLGAFDITKMNKLEIGYHDCVVARHP
jgi:uncharacterized membrane protein YgcG